MWTRWPRQAIEPACAAASSRCRGSLIWPRRWRHARRRNGCCGAWRAASRAGHSDDGSAHEDAVGADGVHVLTAGVDLAHAALQVIDVGGFGQIAVVAVLGWV